MPQKPKYQLAPIDVSSPVGQNISRIRKEKGITQEELANRIGITQALVSKYEKGKLQISSDMLLRFTIALNSSSDRILGIDDQNIDKDISLKISRRMNKIESLPESEKKALLKTIDIYLRNII